MVSTLIGRHQHSGSVDPAAGGFNAGDFAVFGMNRRGLGLLMDMHSKRRRTLGQPPDDRVMPDDAAGWMEHGPMNGVGDVR
jgi:alpha-beta hydrolase superfamily lysophospholipase